MLKFRSTKDRYSTRTHSTPVESMSDGILGFVRFWNHPLVDVLDIFIVATAARFGTAVIDMYVSDHRRANKITHHRCLIIGGELVTPQFESCLVGPINRPAGMCCIPMASFVFLPRVALKIVNENRQHLPHCSLWDGTLPRGRVQK